ncbi:UDP-forming cellulose synthase catalytic subunit [uncultured Roseibium sp.]|uniref:UDP-forming cellulose synthase catalytic subunit n=1 Tax=uncultured Roseibium sp. TaxID=1936171 RepID=UPI00260943C7|nr:UDP-forming cellulose synthase catalytic subunit [uncultured Roseibium sp.]
MLKFLAYLFATVATIAMFFIATLPLSVEVQLFLGLFLLLAMQFTKAIPGTLGRVIFLSLGGIIVGRYVYWRVTQTVPPIENLADFVPGVLLLAAELFCILMFFLSALIVSDRYQRPRKVLTRDEDAPSVDVFIPSYNEDPGLVACTIAAAKNMDYPADKFRVFLLDDGATDQKLNAYDPADAREARDRAETLKRICDELGATYLARERNEHAKAGNLNYGLSRSEGDLVVVFDADHAPAREFLRETVAYFSDPKLFLVQTPHFFLNPDPVERNLRTFNFMPSENDMFYGMIQKGLDKWDATFFCGSGAVLRRSALNEVGGFSGVSITEDCETALELHSRGWKSAYVDRPMIAGLQPDTIASFIGQRSRWCRGMLQILLLKNPLFKPGLNFMQRVAYVSSALFWLFPFPRLVFLLAPLLFILFSMKIYIASPQEFLAYTLTYILAVVTIQSGLYGKLRWPWISELYEYIQSIFLFPAIISVVLNPRSPKFNVTTKGETLEKEQLSVLAWPYVVVFVLMLATTGVLFWRLENDPGQTALLSVVGIWHVFNLIVTGAALGAILERKEVRTAPRIRVQRKGLLKLGEDTVPVTLVEANTNGVLMHFDKVPHSGNMLGERGLLKVLPAQKQSRNGSASTEMEDFGPEDGISVNIASQRASSSGLLVGAGYIDTVAKCAQASSDLVFADLSIPRALHNRKLTGASPIGGMLRLVRWSVHYGIRIPVVAFFSLFGSAARRKSARVENDLPETFMTPAE